MTGSADAFALWLQHDQAAQQVEREPEVQLELEVETFARMGGSGRLGGPTEVPERSVNCLRREHPDHDRSSYA